MKYTNLYTCIYARRSNEDAKDGESIENQVSLMKQYCTDKGYRNIQVFADDGYTGTNFDRPNFQKMYALIKHRRVERVIVKDLSRFGRNSTEVGRYLSIEFPRYNVELVSISDGPESSDPNSIITQFKNMMNEFYAKDISDKQKLSLYARSNNGLHIATSPSFGYKLDPENKHHWIIDEPAAVTVRYIFALYNTGVSVPEIARRLEADKHLSPSAYSGNIAKGSKAEKNPFFWHNGTIISILRRQEYCGDTVNFKTFHKSFKDKQVCYHDEADYKIIKDTQEPIISREDFEKARERRNASKRVKSERVEHLLDSLVFCGNCGSRLYKNKNSNKKKEDIYFYTCNNYRKNKSCTSHYIQEIDLRTKVIQALLTLFSSYREDEIQFKKIITKAVCVFNETEGKRINARVEEINKLISDINAKESKLFDAMDSGRISSETFNSITDNCNEEKEKLMQEQGEAFLKLDEIAEKKKGVSSFMNKVAVYSDYKEEMIDKIVVEQLIEKVEIFETRETLPNKKNVSTIDIHINFVDIGYIEVGEIIKCN